MKRFIHIAKLASINLFVLAVLLLLAEIVLRMLGYGYSNSPADPDPYLHHVHPPAHLYRSYTPGGEFGDFMIYYDSLGRRSPVPGTAAQPPSTNAGIVFTGDSFVEALQVPYEQSFTGLLAKAYPDKHIINYGVTGYSPLLNYLQCRKMLYSHKVTPAAVVMLLYSNDVRDDSTYYGRATRDGSGQVLAVNGGRPSGFVSFARRFYLARLARKAYIQWKYRKIKGMAVNGLLEEQPDIANTLTEIYLLKTDSLLKAHHIGFYLSAIPSRYEHLTGKTIDGRFSQKAQAWAAAHGIPFISLDSAFAQAGRREQLFFKKDIHLTPAGHRVVAAALGNGLAAILKP